MPDCLAQQVGQNIKKLRKLKGISRYDLSDSIDVAYSTIGLWENGKAFPRTSAIEKLSDFFDVSKEFLLGESNDEIPKPKNKLVIDLNDILDDQVLVIYKNQILNESQKKQLDFILKGLFLNEKQ